MATLFPGNDTEKHEKEICSSFAVNPKLLKENNYLIYCEDGMIKFGNDVRGCI